MKRLTHLFIVILVLEMSRNEPHSLHSLVNLRLQFHHLNTIIIIITTLPLLFLPPSQWTSGAVNVRKIEFLWFDGGSSAVLRRWCGWVTFEAQFAVFLKHYWGLVTFIICLKILLC